MPRTNSDADERASLTSDDEAVGPTSGRINENGDDIRPAASYQPSTTEYDVDAESVRSGLKPSETPIAKFRSSVNKVCHKFLSRRSWAKSDVILYRLFLCAGRTLL